MQVTEVVSIENARKLKRLGVLQDSQAYWHCIVASLNTVEGMMVAQEERSKMRWILVLGKPQEPHCSAFTLAEIKKLFKTMVSKEKLPIIRKEEDHYIGSVAKKDMYMAKTEQDVIAQALLYALI